MKKYLNLAYLIMIVSFLPACSLFRGATPSASPDGAENSTELGSSISGEDTPSESSGLDDSDVDDEDIEYIDEEDLEIVDIIEEDAEEEENLKENPLESDTALEAGDSIPESQEDASIHSATTLDEDQNTPFPPQNSLETRENTASTKGVKKWIPLKKIKTTPYKAYNTLVNTVYIARPKDTISSISHKIFAEDRSETLYTLNPYLKNRTLKVGDKIYYPSLNHPDREDKILFYFEDKGVPAKSYTIESGGNIRKIATLLLGHANSWKEIWATNPGLISKTQVEQEVIIKYWEVGADENTTLSDVSSANKEEVAVGEGELESSGLDESEAKAYDNAELANNSEEARGPLEDQPASSLPPPLPPDEEEEKEEGGGDSYSSDINSHQKEATAGVLAKLRQLPVTTILLALVALILCILTFIVIKKRKKKVEYDYTATNFEIDDQ